MPVPFDIGPTTVEASAAAGAAVIGWAGNGSDRIRFDPIAIEGLRIAPAAAGLSVSAPRGVSAAGRVELDADQSTLRLAELRTGWEAPKGYGGVGIGRIHVPLGNDRRYEVEAMALSFRPVLSQTALPLHAPGIDGRIAWPDRAKLAVGTFWSDPSTDSPYLWTRLDLTPLGPLPDHEDGDCNGVCVAGGGSMLLQRSPLRGSDTWVSGDLTLGWRSIAVDVGWTNRNRAGTISDDQWVAARSRLVRLPAGTDLYFAARLEWVDGLVVGESARNLATGRLSWRIHPINKMSDDPDAWAAVYAEGAFSRESGPGAGFAGTGEALTLSAERPNDWLQVGVWTRW